MEQKFGTEKESEAHGKKRNSYDDCDGGDRMKQIM
jgi:hypothetical protein